MILMDYFVACEATLRSPESSILTSRQDKTAAKAEREAGYEERIDRDRFYFGQERIDGRP